MRETLGRLLNWLGWPGFVQDTEYRGQGTRALVHVKTTRLYTIVTVNGVAVYFDRLTGRIDGTGASQTSGLQPERTARSIDFVAPPELGQETTRKQTPSGHASLPGQQARHRDGDTSRNGVDNIEWGTQSQNEADKRRHGRAATGLRNGNGKFSDDVVAKVRSAKRGEVADVARAHGISLQHAYNIRSGIERRS